MMEAKLKVNIKEDPEVLQVLGLDHLDFVGIDDHDFSDLPVWVIAQAVELAYQKGYAKGIEDHLRNGQ